MKEGTEKLHWVLFKNAGSLGPMFRFFQASVSGNADVDLRTALCTQLPYGALPCNHIIENDVVSCNGLNSCLSGNMTIQRGRIIKK